MLSSRANQNILRKGRFNAPFLFIAALALLNLGVYTLLKPEQKLMTSLPFSLKEDNGWQVLKGDWSWQQGSLKQLSEDSALMVSPFRLTGQARQIHVQLAPSAGMSFAMQKGSSLKQSQIIYASKTALIAGFIDEKGQLIRQATHPLENNQLDDLRISIALKTNSYDVLLNQKLIAQDLTLEYQTGAVAVMAEGPSEVRGLLIDGGVYVQPQFEGLAEARSYSSDFALGLEPDWQVLSGEWFSKGGKLYQTQREGFNHSLVIPLQQQPKQITLRFQELQGSGSGLVFNLASISSLAGGQLIRLEEQNGIKQVFWGYFNDKADFVGQGAARLPESSDASTELSISLDLKSFSVLVNGQSVAKDVTLFASGQHIALSSSESQVAFDALEVSFEAEQGTN